MQNLSSLCGTAPLPPFPQWSSSGSLLSVMSGNHTAKASSFFRAMSHVLLYSHLLDTSAHWDCLHQHTYSPFHTYMRLFSVCDKYIDNGCHHGVVQMFPRVNITVISLRRSNSLAVNFVILKCNVLNKENPITLIPLWPHSSHYDQLIPLWSTHPVMSTHEYTSCTHILHTELSISAVHWLPGLSFISCYLSSGMCGSSSCYHLMSSQEGKWIIIPIPMMAMKIV